MSAPALKPMSVEEYLRSEELSDIKREYVGGFVYPLHGATRAQAGASREHVRICVNIVQALDNTALSQGCLTYLSDMRLRVEGADNFYYPDVMLVCKPDTSQTGIVFETAPCLLVEVLSKSTARNDRLAKHAAYTAIPSLQTYLIVEQTKRKVYVYERTGTGWTSSELTRQGSVSISCLDTTLTLDQIYRALPI
jgi:Uma2 family endonuclease